MLKFLWLLLLLAQNVTAFSRLSNKNFSYDWIDIPENSNNICENYTIIQGHKSKIDEVCDGPKLPVCNKSGRQVSPNFSKPLCQEGWKAGRQESTAN